jgi:hypothetical protein
MADVLVTLLDSAGELTAACAKNLAANNYTVRPDGIAPDDRYAMSLLAEQMVMDKCGIGTISDRVRLHGSDYSLTQKHEARSRMTLRAALTDDLLAMAPARRRALIDDLAAGRGKQAAQVLRDDAAAVAAAIRDDLTAGARLPAASAS